MLCVRFIACDSWNATYMLWSVGVTCRVVFGVCVVVCVSRYSYDLLFDVCCLLFNVCVVVVCADLFSLSCVVCVLCCVLLDVCVTAVVCCLICTTYCVLFCVCWFSWWDVCCVLCNILVCVVWCVCRLSWYVLHVVCCMFVFVLCLWCFAGRALFDMCGAYMLVDTLCMLFDVRCLNYGVGGSWGVECGSC